MARAGNPKLMMLDEPASGLSRGERVALTELLLELDPLDHADPDRARHGRRAPGRRPGDDDARRPRRSSRGRRTRSARTRWCTTSTSGRGTSPMPEGAFSRQGLSAFYGSAQALEDVTFEMGSESVAIVGRNGMGKTTLCNAIMGISPPRARGSIRFDGAARSSASPRARSRTTGVGLRAPGAAALSLAQRATSTWDDRRPWHRGAAPWDVRSIYELSRASPSEAATAARSCRGASSRCSRSAVRCSRTRSS